MENDIIMISKRVNRNLGMRSSAKSFFKELNNTFKKEIIISFENVEFMSRSFAQEYIQQKKRSNKSINEIKLPEDVEKMFKVVINSSKPKSHILANQLP